MHLNPVRGLVSLCLALAAFCSPTSHAAEAEPARVIVKYKALGALMRGADNESAVAAAGGPRHAATLARRHGLALQDGRVIDRQLQSVVGDRSLSSPALAARLAADPDVEYAVPDRRRRIQRIPNDPLYEASSTISPTAGQWYLQFPDSIFRSAINAPGAWDITTGSASIVVGVLDTGVRFDHPDLSGKLLAGYDFIGTSSVAGDGNGRDSDASDPGDSVVAGECGTGEPAENSSWHGTQTAGLIGANTGNGVGMASIGWNVKVLPLRVLGKCGGFDSDIIAAMLWGGGVSTTPFVNPNPARVLNLSLGGSGSCEAVYQDAIDRLNAAGVVVVVSAGNEEGLAVTSPANCRGAIGVTALRHVGTKVGFANVGPELTIAAPGGNCVNLTGDCLYPILTTTNTGATSPSTSGYTSSSNPSLGTSFSAPLVSGTVALMLSANPSLTPAQVKSMLQSTARPFPTTSSDPTVLACHAPNGVAQDECICTTSTCGAGMLDAQAAVSAAATGTVPLAKVTASASSVQVGTSVTFSGTGSTVPSGRTLSTYAWSITSGSGIASLSGAANGSSATVTTSGAGSFTITLTITDSTGAQGSTSSTVTVTAPAAPTVRILASAQVVAAGTAVTLDGSTSSAASGLSVAAYQWSITSGSSLASLATAASGSTVTINTAGSGSGPFTVQLTVTDSLGQQSSGSVTVTVSAVAPTATISASATSVTTGTNVTFDGSGSTATTGRTITRYQWALTSGAGVAAISGSTTGSSATVTTSAAGSFTIQLTVTDSSGAVAARSSTVTVTAPAPASSGGGGGAMSAGWLAALLAATLWLRRERRQA